MRVKKIPLRKCLSCNEMKEKNELVRVVKTKDNDIIVDETGKLNGRGAYICKAEACIDDVNKHNKLARALKSPISEDVYQSLLDIVNHK